MTPSNGCCSPSRVASAPASRWRSRRWRGWCAASSRPCTATTRSSTTSSIVERFERQGVVFVDDIADVPPGTPIMLSAHGSAPEVVAAARARGSYVVDSVCPLVTKVHHEVRVRAGKGYRIVYVGHEGHEEAVGTMAVAPGLDQPGRVGRPRSTRSPEFDEPVALLAQTTLSHRDWDDVAVAVQRALPRRVDARPQRPVLRHHQPPVGADGDGRALRRDRRDRLGQLVEHAGAREAGPRGRVPTRRAAINTADELPAEFLAAHASSASPPARRRPTSWSRRSSTALAPTEGVELVRGHRGGRVLPAAAQPPRAAGARSRRPRRRCSAARSATGRRVDDRGLAASDVLAALAR